MKHLRQMRKLEKETFLDLLVYLFVYLQTRIKKFCDLAF